MWHRGGVGRTGGGATRAPKELLVSAPDAAPAIFTTDGSGAGQGAIVNQNSTANSPSNPAEKGSIIIVFAGGAGQADPFRSCSL